MKKIFTLLTLLAFFITAKSQSTSIVLSQVYPGGGATSGAPAYKHDYVELHNITSNSISLGVAGDSSTAWSIQYGSQNGNVGGSATSRAIITPGVVIPAGGYYLIQITSTGGTVVGSELPVAPDLTIPTGAPAMSATNGKLVLRSDTTLIRCGQTSLPQNLCATWPPSGYVDMVGWGRLPKSVSNCEGCTYSDSTATVLGGTASLNSRVVAVRKNNGCQDTDNNAADFDTIPNALPRNSASAVFICSSTAPVKLNGFTLQKTNTAVGLVWSTEQEFNNKAFVVQRSNDGVNWVDISIIPTAGNNSSPKNYTSTDNNPLSGFNYYRLKQVNEDGTYNLSAVKKVFFSVNYKVLIAPNPATDFINVYVSKDNNTNTIVKVTDINGKIVRSENSALSTISIPTSGLAKGVYFVKIIDATNVTTKKVSIQ
ncbi:MAG: T9SS type A sorting domain-containing protein [Bacteroidota bacterium]